MKYFFIINPNAGTKNGKNKFIEELEIIQNQIKSLDIEYFYFITEYKGYATEIVRKICDFYSNEVIRIIVCGGTGSFYETINGIKDFSKVELALYPIGTHNDVVKGFGFDIESFKNIKSLVEGDIVKTDVIKVNDNYSINAVSVGFDAQMVYDMNRDIMRVFESINNNLRFILSIIKNSFSKLDNKYNIDIDGVDHSGTYTIITVLNGYCYDGSFITSECSKSYNGILNLLLVSVNNIFQVLPFVLSLKKGVSEDKKDLAKTTHFKKLKLSREDKSELIISIDGEIIIASEAIIEVIPSVLNFIIPKNTAIGNV